VAQAIELADLAEGDPRIDLLHVSERPAEYLPLDEWIWGEERDQHRIDDAIREAARAAFDDFLATLPADARARVTPRHELGVPWQTIVRVAEEGGHDLIVMGTHGHTGVEHILLGSVAERVLRHAPCPVMTVR
jgi:nucleotide-binding universal stress UspA family protein